jgi:CxxC motif-containing protein (DUF1111 family)
VEARFAELGCAACHRRELNTGEHARSLTEAILWHGGEARVARDRFARLPKQERDCLLAFLQSL